MSEQILQISIRIKELRQICEYTVEQAARAARSDGGRISGL